MGHRLSKIITRTGDDGATGLADGARLAKDAPRIQALGEVDELNSLLGVVLAEELPSVVRAWLTAVQHDLFDLGGELCLPGSERFPAGRVAQLEAWAEEANADLPPLKEFILPGGSRAASLLHLARTVCRRAERSVVALHRAEPVGEAVRRYLNRLSDLFFILARVANRASGQSDVLWQRARTDD